jgi:protease II
MTPPIPRRDEDAVVYAGAAPAGWDLSVPRQGDNSEEPLMDPPVKVPNPYGWMRSDDRSSEEVVEHLTQENAYTDSVTAHLEDLRSNVYKELVGAIQETDHTTPRPRGPYYYYTRTFEGKSYKSHCRAPKTDKLEIKWDGSAETPILPNEECILDVNELAKDKDYCSPGAVVTSPSHKLVAYSVDFSGDETCVMFVKNLETGQIVHHDENLVISGSLRFGADDNTLFYLKQNAVKRPFQIWRKRLDNDQPDELLFEELDELFWTGIYKSLDGKYLFVEASSTDVSEIHFLDLEVISWWLELVLSIHTLTLSLSLSQIYRTRMPNCSAYQSVDPKFSMRWSTVWAHFGFTPTSVGSPTLHSLSPRPRPIVKMTGS